MYAETRPTLKQRALTLLALCAIGAAPLAEGAHAAPDGTLGVAFLGAQVDRDGNLTGGSGASGSTRLLPGVYVVDFARNVSNCYYYAVSLEGTVATSVQPRSGDGNGVFVAFSSLGSTSTSPAPTDSQFQMMVYCGRDLRDAPRPSTSVRAAASGGNDLSQSLRGSRP